MDKLRLIYNGDKYSKYYLQFLYISYKSFKFCGHNGCELSAGYDQYAKYKCSVAENMEIILYHCGHNAFIYAYRCLRKLYVMMKKFFILILLSVLVLSMRPWRFFIGTTYYVKLLGGTGTGLDDAHAWSLAKFNTISLQPGDVVNFNRGDVFPGAMTNLFGGTLANPVTLTTYGSGAQPKFSGYTALTSWTLSSDNIYYATVSQATVRNVLFDGKQVGMGRYPNVGYNYITSHVADSTISDPTIGLIPFDPTGGEAVIRKDRYILDRHKIISRTGDLIRYQQLNGDGDLGYTGSYWPQDSNGYFIQAHIGTLDLTGEWYFDATASRLYMYLPGGISGHTVSVATVESLFYLYSQSNISFNNLDFEGSNTYGGYMAGASRVTYRGCNFNNIGLVGLYGITDTTINLLNTSISNCLSNGLFIEYQGSYINVDSTCRFVNIGMITGMQRSGDGSGNAIGISADHITVKNSSIKKVGYCGISANGDSPNVKYNNLDTVCYNKDDGGGIYTYTGVGAKFISNYITHCFGDYNGAHWNPDHNYGMAAGIYIDNSNIARNATVDSNTIIYGDWAGIVHNNVSGNKIRKNRVANFRFGLLLLNFDGGISGSTVKYNYVTAYNWQLPFRIEMGAANNLAAMGSIDSNYYQRDSTVAGLFKTGMVSLYRNYGSRTTVEYTIPGWSSISTQDANTLSNTYKVNVLTFKVK